MLGISFAPDQTVEQVRRAKSFENNVQAPCQIVQRVCGSCLGPLIRSLLQIGVAGILVLDTKENGPARKAGLQGTRRDEYGR